MVVMDDRIFDDETALQWIDAIESANTSIRDRDIHPEIQSWVEKNSLTEILEIGSGQGICSDKINLDDRRYTGVDPSPKMIERAQQLYSRENRSFVGGNIYSLPFASEIFDGAFSILVWHLLSNLEAAARELARVLKPGGQFLIVTANPKAYAAWKAFYDNFQLDGKRLEGTMILNGSQSHDVLFLHTIDELSNSLKKFSLNIQEEETFRPDQSGVHLLISIKGKKV